MTAATWKSTVQLRFPRAVAWTKNGKPGEGSRYVCYAEPDGRELGVSTISTADAWRVAALNIRDNVPADKAPGQTLLL